MKNKHILIAFIGLSVLFPPFLLFGMIPFRLEDIIVLYLFSKILKKRVELSYNIKKIILFFTLYVITIFISINLSYDLLGIKHNIRDYFEIINVIKILLLIIVGNYFAQRDSNYYKNSPGITIIDTLQTFIFISAIIGIMQYFNLFNFTKWFVPLYRLSNEQFHTMQLVSGVANRRIVGTSGNPNHFAVLLNIGYAISIMNYTHNKKIKNLIAAIVIIIALLLTLSRTGIVVWIFSSMLILYFVFRGNNKLRNLIMIVIALTVVIHLFNILPKNFINRFKINVISKFENKTLLEDQSFTARKDIIWADALKDFKVNPIFGIGPAKSIRVSIVDNSYIKILRSYGISGLLIFLMILYYINKKAYLVNRMLSINNSRILIIFTSILLLSAITIDVFNNSQIQSIYWFICGYMLLGKPN